MTRHWGRTLGRGLSMLVAGGAGWAISGAWGVWRTAAACAVMVATWVWVWSVRARYERWADARERRRWDLFCEDLPVVLRARLRARPGFGFYDLARGAPERLRELLSADVLRPMNLGFAAEWHGEACATRDVLRDLADVLAHDHPLARVGAVHGLIGHRADPAVRGYLRVLAATDRDDDVRAEAARWLAWPTERTTS